MSGKAAIYQRSTGEHETGALRQAEIITNLVQARLDISSIRSPDGLIVHSKVHPYAIVMTQDCDLDWDFRARQSGEEDGKVIPSVLFCEMDRAEALRSESQINSSIWKRISQNKDERYHFLEAIPPEADVFDQGLPELAIDFKRYFTIPTEELYLRLELEARRRCRLNSPYLEHLASRFAYYISRIGLPRDYESE